MDEVSDFLPTIGKHNPFSKISLRKLAQIGLAPARFSDCSGLIKHVHLEKPAAYRRHTAITSPNDEFDYRPFLSSLKNVHYDGVIALPEDADSRALQYCRRLWLE